MTVPVALCGPVMAMARPSRPPAEAILVRAAVREVDLDGKLSAPAVAREIAKRIVELLLIEVQRDPSDIMDYVLSAVGRTLPSAIMKLSTCYEINNYELFVQERVRHLVFRNGRSISPREDEAELRMISDTIAMRLSRRYLSYIRSSANPS